MSKRRLSMKKRQKINKHRIVQNSALEGISFGFRDGKHWVDVLVKGSRAFVSVDTVYCKTLDYCFKSKAVFLVFETDKYNIAADRIVFRNLIPVGLASHKRPVSKKKAEIFSLDRLDTPAQRFKRWADQLKQNKANEQKRIEKYKKSLKREKVKLEKLEKAKIQLAKLQAKILKLEKLEKN